MKILVVDDKPENLHLLHALLQGNGHEVNGARQGAEALVKARQSPPDIVIADLLMPVMDGFTLLRHWKSDAQLKEIPFVVHTATYTEPKDEQLALDLGADAFILKPSEPDDFMARLLEVLANRKLGAVTPVRQRVGEEKVVLKEYSEVLVRKLEEKALQLEEANRRLQQDVIERERDGEALRESEVRLRMALDAAHMGTFDWDVPRDHVVWSRWHEEMWGFALGEFGGTYEAFSKRVHPDDMPSIAAEGARCIAAREAFAREFRVVWPDGSVHWIQARGEFTFGGDGQPLGMRGAVIEVTARKLAEEALRKSEAQFHTMCEASPLGIFLVRPDGHATYCNPADMRMTGLSLEDTLGFGWMNAIHPDDRERVMAKWRECAASGEDYVDTGRYLRADGSIIWWGVTTAPVLEGGTLLGYVGMATDVTERKLAEEKIESQLHELQRWHEVTMGREKRVMALKREVNELLAARGEPARYQSQAQPVPPL